jgi:hypothetical protein
MLTNQWPRGKIYEVGLKGGGFERRWRNEIVLGIVAKEMGHWSP